MSINLDAMISVKEKYYPEPIPYGKLLTYSEENGVLICEAQEEEVQFREREKHDLCYGGAGLSWCHKGYPVSFTHWATIDISK